MTKERFFELLNHTDEDLLARAEQAKPKQRKKKSPWLKWGAIAACICLLIGAAISLPLLHDHPPADDSSGSQSTYHPNILNAMESPEQLNGLPLAFVVGSSAAVDVNASSEPPLFEFGTGGIVVKARAIKNFPDLYYQLDVSSEYKPTAYRLIQMETVEVIHGEGVPQTFLYLLPSYLFVDLSVYDSLLISMPQIGTENYVLRNETQNRMEALPLPVFGESEPELGDLIAFTDGIFDESLWQTASWSYGYQFARHDLENPESSHLVVSRGCTEGDAIDEIQRRILADKEWLGDRYKVPDVLTLHFTSEEAKAALDFVKPFENGVFSQRILPYNGNGELVYTRFINGCQTEETVRIDLLTEEVTYSEVRYTKEDMSAMEDISAQISKRAEEYAEQIPPPPHMNPEGKELLCLCLYGWYAKAGDRVYGVVKTAWRYEEESDWYLQYYDETYTVYDAVSATATTMSAEELAGLLGPRNIHKGEPGVGIEMPME